MTRAVADDELSLNAPVADIGPWWDGRGENEIDLLGLTREHRPVLACEAKWSRSVNGDRLVRQLRRKIESGFGDTEGVRFVIAARDEVENLPPDAIAVTASDVFAPPPG